MKYSDKEIERAVDILNKPSHLSEAAKLTIVMDLLETGVLKDPSWYKRWYNKTMRLLNGSN